MYWTKFPKEIQDLMDIVEPYIEKCHLREDAPQEIKDTYKQIQAMLDEYSKHPFDVKVVGTIRL